MKVLDVVTLILVIIGGLVWGLIGLMDYNPVSMVFGASVTQIVYILVGAAAIWQLIPLVRSMSSAT
jgi:uncharacterized protein